MDRPEDYSILDNIPMKITEKDNDRMIRPSKPEKVREVFYLNKESACGTDDFSRDFFQICWDIVKKDILKLVMDFFCGYELRNTSHTLIWC